MKEVVIFRLLVVFLKTLLMKMFRLSLGATTVFLVSHPQWNLLNMQIKGYSQDTEIIFILYIEWVAFAKYPDNNLYNRISLKL